MRQRSVAATLAAIALTVTACQSRKPASLGPQPPKVPLPQMAGTLAVSGLAAPVSVVRDEWGVPHLSAQTTDDLFFAQGFVQAQDRLFQMDLWRRASLGRLSEVLGANFVQRDAMTRRMQYRGDIDAEWRAYGPETKSIVSAFVRGINAWIEHSRGAWPDEFRLAGWTPEPWKPEDLLNRTDAFASSRGAEEEVLCAELLAAGATPLPIDPCANAGSSADVDLAIIPHSLADMPKRVGARPFFAGYAAPFSGGSNAWAVEGTRTRSGSPMLAVDPHRPFESPALRYLIHLTAPGWNVAGATSPWLPGIVVGHNERVAWGMTAQFPDTQDIYVERVNPANPRQVQYRGRWEDMTIVADSFAVKGREETFDYEQQYTRHGPVVGLDRQRNLAYVLRWSGVQAGAASELAALGMNRAASIDQLRAAIDRWQMPPVEFVMADIDGQVGSQPAFSTPRRQGFTGAIPVAGWTGTREWTGIERPPISRGNDVVISTNGDPTRQARITELLRTATPLEAAQFDSFQRDVTADDASVLLAELSTVPIDDPALVAARQRLLTWDRRLTASADAQLFVAFGSALDRLVMEQLKIPTALQEPLSRRYPSLTARLWRSQPRTLVPTPELLRSALAKAVEATQAPRAGDSWAAEHQVAFTHPLAISDAARARFNVGPFLMDGGSSTVQAISDQARVGPALRAVFDLSNWDAARVMNAPGQSGWPDSLHYRDLAALWAEGTTFPLAFTAAAVQRAAKATLTLQPK